MTANLAMSSGFVAATAASIALMILYPLVLAFIVHRRFAASWRWFAYGAAIFFLFQMVTRVPAVQVIQAVITPRLQASRLFLWGWLVILALSAGLFEEVGRYLGFRVLFRRDEKSWRSAVMFGVGHGGLESMLLIAGLALLTLLNLQALASGGLERLPPEQRAVAAAQLQAIAAQPGWFPLLGAWERLWALSIHVALSVIVVQVYRRNSLLWLWLAIVSHTVFDFVSVALPQLLGQSTRTTILLEAVVAAFGILALWTTWSLRDRPEQFPDAPASRTVAPPPLPVQ